MKQYKRELSKLMKVSSSLTAVGAEVVEYTFSCRTVSIRMFKETLLCALVAAVCFCGSAQGVSKTYTADMDFLHIQKKIYELLLYVKQNQLFDTEYYDVGRNYDIESNIDMYKDKEVVFDFLQFYKSGMLHRDAIFSPYYEEHRQQMYLLFKLFYTAKDFTTFYKTASWARLYLNDGVFTNAFTIAVFYRPECKYMHLPAPYEIYPNLFFDSNVIQEAHHIQMTRGAVSTSSLENIETYMIYANYSSYYMTPYFDEEYKLDYWMEDVGLNTFYYYFRMVMPFWLNSKEVDMPKDIRGSFYFYIHQQLLGRYMLERFSNGLGDINEIYFTKPVYPGYYSSLMYANGINLPQRERYAEVPYYKYKYLKEAEVLETRILNIIDSGYVYDETNKQISIYTHEGLNILGNIIEGNGDTCNKRYYGMFDAIARDVLGYNVDYYNPNKVIPSALQSYATSMRDPAFYRLYSKIVNFFYRFKHNAPVYTKTELAFPGVKFESVEMDKLITYFDYCDTVINNAVSVENFKQGTNFRIKARRYCLNYKPFTYRFNVNCDKDTKAVLKIFLGPAFGEHQQDFSYLYKYYKYFVEMDQFVVTLKSGMNNIERRSTDAFFTSPEITPIDVYYKKLLKSVSGGEPFTYYDRLYSYPNRLYLPKGKPEGMKFMMYFYLSPLDESKLHYYELPVFGKVFTYGKPTGFPLDKPVYPYKFLTSNMYFKDVFIYHTEDYQKTVTH